MIAGLLAVVWMLSAPPPEGGEAKADQVEARAPGDAAALAEYNALSEKTPNSAEAQWKLALWCEKKGLKAEALVHLAAVLKLEPRRSAAWEKLGFKKVHGRWASEEQIRDEAQQKKADKEWIARLRAWHVHVHGGPKQAEVRAAMAEVVDPRAVPAIYYVFGRRGPIDQGIAIQLLGQVLSPESSKGLAVLAVYGASAEVRGRATQTLRQREPQEYLGLLAGLLTDLLKFRVQPVGGPGSPGILMVEGERFSERRFYAPPPPPTLNFQPGDIVSYDEFGLPAITRPVGDVSSVQVGQTGNVIDGGTTTYQDLSRGVRYSLGEGLLAAQVGAYSAQAQLRDDVKQVEGFNMMRKAFNEHVLDVARAAMGEDLGQDPMPWRRKALEVLGATDPEPIKDRPKPTLDMLVPLAYQPVFGQMVVSSQMRTVINPPDN